MGRQDRTMKHDARNSHAESRADRTHNAHSAARARRARAAAAATAFEPLESRTMMSASALPRAADVPQTLARHSTISPDLVRSLSAKLTRTGSAARTEQLYAGTG